MFFFFFLLIIIISNYEFKICIFYLVQPLDDNDDEKKTVSSNIYGKHNESYIIRLIFHQHGKNII
jgi:hypothetical protein